MAKRDKPETTTVSTETVYVYANDGRHLNGLPARDLTATEWSEQDSDLCELALKLGLYTTEEREIVQPEPTPDTAADAPIVDPDTAGADVPATEDI